MFCLFFINIWFKFKETDFNCVSEHLFDVGIREMDYNRSNRLINTAGNSENADSLKEYGSHEIRLYKRKNFEWKVRYDAGNR